MSTATATDAPLPTKGHKKLILIVALALLLLGGAGGGALLLLKNSAQEEIAEDEDGAPAPGTRTSSGSPTFVPLDMFTVNLADRNADRYAQIGITLEIDGSGTGDRIKAFMPAVRNNILMAIADRTAGELLAREGKTELAERVKRETARALGYQVPDPEPEDAAAPARKKARVAETSLPVRAVHFSNFIIQ